MVNNLSLIFLLFRPIGMLYALLMRLREIFFKTNIFKRHAIDVPIVSVGNLVLGGSGKTPVVIYLAKLFIKHGYKTAVVSRGYGGTASRRVNIVSDGKRILLSSKESGDEPRFIAETVPEVMVVTGKKRVYPCNYAVNNLNCDVIILDDGFQHMAVSRDLDLVLFNGADLYSNMHVFPGGMLREPFSALNRADCFLITNCSKENYDKVRTFSKHLENVWSDKPVYRSNFLPQCFVDREGNTFPLDLKSTKVFAFCGIASPSRFNKTLEDLSINIVAFKSFQDHKRYSEDAIRKIENLAHQYGAEILLTTEKDMVKLAECTTTLPIYALSMNVTFERRFDDFVISHVKRKKQSDQYKE